MNVCNEIIERVSKYANVIKYKTHQKMYGTETLDYTLDYIYLKIDISPIKSATEYPITLIELVSMFPSPDYKIIEFKRTKRFNKYCIYKIIIRTDN